MQNRADEQRAKRKQRTKTEPPPPQSQGTDIDALRAENERLKAQVKTLEAARDRTRAHHRSVPKERR